MDRLIALVRLRFTLELRALLGARERWLGALLALPAGLLLALLGALVAFLGVRATAAVRPEALAPVLSLLATAVGIFWALAPLLAGVARAESHDLTRLLHFPIPLPVLVLSSLCANLAQPMLLFELPIAAALAAALSRHAALFPLSFLGVLLSLGVVVAFAQAAGLVLHGLSRNRRRHDLALFFGLALGFLLSLAPFLLLAAGRRGVGLVARAVVRGDPFVYSPFGWGLRAALYFGRGELAGGLAFSLAALLAITAVLSLSGVLAARLYRGELDLGPAPALPGRPARTPLPGAIGALFEKDLRLLWRDPALKAVTLLGLAGPLLLLIFAAGLRAGRLPATSVLFFASFVGLSGFGSNAFGLERRGIALLFGFPVERWRILIAKNAGAALLRLPALGLLGVAALCLAPLAYLPAALAITLSTLLVAAGMDNFMSILFPVTAPAAGGDPYTRRPAGGRGFGAILVSLVMLAAVAVVSAPFVFLAWLPLLLDLRWLWALSLPLALAGAASVYALLVGGAARLLSRREPELIGRVLGDA